MVKMDKNNIIEYLEKNRSLLYELEKKLFSICLYYDTKKQDLYSACIGLLKTNYDIYQAIKDGAIND